MTAMDPQTAAADTEAFIAAWNTNCAEYLGDVVSQAGYDATTPLLTTAHLRALLDERDQLAAELEHSKRAIVLPVLRQAWRNGWSDRTRAVRDAVRTSDNDRDTYERAFARYMSDDPAAPPTRPAGSRTGTGEGLTLSTPAHEAQQDTESDGDGR